MEEKKGKHTFFIITKSNLKVQIAWKYVKF